MSDDERVLECQKEIRRLRQCVSGFISNSDRTRYVYFYIPDVRYTRNWHKQVLVRNAKNRHDYIGGINNYTSLEDFGERVKNECFPLQGRSERT